MSCCGAWDITWKRQDTSCHNTLEEYVKVETLLCRIMQLLTSLYNWCQSHIILTVWGLLYKWLYYIMAGYTVQYLLYYCAACTLFLLDYTQPGSPHMHYYYWTIHSIYTIHTISDEASHTSSHVFLLTTALNPILLHRMSRLTNTVGYLVIQPSPMAQGNISYFSSSLSSSMSLARYLQ